MINYFLIVDDTLVGNNSETVIRKIDENRRLVIASSGKDGVRAFRNVKPKAVWINFRLPDMTGLECLRTIRSAQRNIKSRLYLYNDTVTGHLQRNAIESGAAECFVADGKATFEMLKANF